MIIACDFDGTIEKDGKPNISLINKLREEQRRGNVVILWTCRSGIRLNEAIHFMTRYGLRPNYVNANVPKMVSKFGCDSRKVFADVYIDDKAVRA